MQTATDPLIGRTLEGRYRIIERVARGGMSTVYSAVDGRLDRLVAVKVMSAALSSDPAFSDRFAREARAAARLSNLNTVSVYDQGIDDGDGAQHVFLVMELVEGRTLRDLIRERGPLSVPQAVSIMEPVLSALAAAHRAGIIHRDVKPENILLSDDGVVKVADFGLARAIESEASATRTGLMMGTVAYCAPEQISRGIADQRSDVYAAGVVLFELLTGSTPFQGETAMTVAYQHVHSRVPAPSTRVAGVPQPLDELVVAATDSDPNGRPADAGAFLAELADVRTALRLPVLGVPPRARTAPRTAHPGHTGQVTAPTAVVRAPSGAVHDTSVVPGPPGRGGPPAGRPPGPSRKPASAAARRRRRTLITLIVVALLGLGAGYTGWWFASGRYSRIPNVSGDSTTQAGQALRAAGYKVSATVQHEFSETVPAGVVAGTSPGAGDRKQRGSTIQLVVSKGKERYTIPATTGQSVAAARAALGKYPLQISDVTTSQPNDTVPSGKVIGTDPPAGASVKRDTPVTLVVSTGPPIIAVPNIDPGTNADDAAQTLTTAGFKVKITQDYSDTFAKNTVISIDPTGQARKGSTITMLVSKGPNTVVIPDFGALPPLADVQRQLERLGLKVKVEQAFGGHSQRVVGIDPPSGTTVAVGSTVTVTIV